MFVVNSAGFDETSTIIVTLEVIQYLNHWRIQDFPGGCQIFFAENCMKMKEFGPPGSMRPWRPLGSNNVN